MIGVVCKEVRPRAGGARSHHRKPFEVRDDRLHRAKLREHVVAVEDLADVACFSGALGLIHSRRLSRSTSSRSQSTGGGGIVIHTTPPEVIGEARPTHADMRSELRSLALCPRSGRRGFLSARSSPGVARTHRAPCRRASRSKLDERHAIDQAAPRCAELRRHAGSELSRSPRRRYADAPAPQPPGDRGTLDP